MPSPSFPSSPRPFFSPLHALFSLLSAPFFLSSLRPRFPSPPLHALVPFLSMPSPCHRPQSSPSSSIIVVVRHAGCRWSVRLPIGGAGCRWTVRVVYWVVFLHYSLLLGLLLNALISTSPHLAITIVANTVVIIIAVAASAATVVVAAAAATVVVVIAAAATAVVVLAAAASAAVVIVVVAAAAAAGVVVVVFAEAAGIGVVVVVAERYVPAHIPLEGEGKGAPGLKKKTRGRFFC